MSRNATRWATAGVASAHLLALWALLQVDSVRDAVREVAPMVVDLIAPPSPTPAPPPPPTPAATPRVLTPAPVLAAPSPAPPPAEAYTAPPPPEPVAVAVNVGAPPAPPAPPAPASPPPAPPPRKLLSGSAVQYLVEPPVEVPRLSRRAGEHGTVWLRVVVDVRGLPAQVLLQRSSGYARLDEQALWAMRQARFRPHTEDGKPIEVEVAAPIEYPLQ
jgi:protein TonB